MATVVCATGTWSGRLRYAFHDHSGLDWEDVLKHGEDRPPQYHTGAFFKAWYILQHWRDPRPFITEFQREVVLGGRRAEAMDRHDARVTRRLC